MNFLDWILYRLNSKIARNLSSSIFILHANFQRPARASACKFSTHLAKLDRNFKPPTVLCKCCGSLQANFQAWSQYCRRACSPLPRCWHSNFQPPLKSLHANFNTCSHLLQKFAYKRPIPPRKFARNLLEVCMQSCKLSLPCAEWAQKSTLKTKELPKKNSFYYLQYYLCH